MTAENIKQIIKRGEGIDVEFKKSSNQLPKNIYDSICAFLNRKGGHIILGVDDNGSILGINKETISEQLNTLAKGLNNPEIMSPTVYLSPEIISIDKKQIVWIYVPEG